MYFFLILIIFNKIYLIRSKYHHSSSECTLEKWQWRGASYSSNPQNRAPIYLSIYLSIYLFYSKYMIYKTKAVGRITTTLLLLIIHSQRSTIQKLIFNAINFKTSKRKWLPFYNDETMHCRITLNCNANANVTKIYFLLLLNNENIQKVWSRNMVLFVVI